MQAPDVRGAVEGALLELAFLAEHAETSTTLIALPGLPDWDALLDTVGGIEAMLEQAGLDVHFQVVGFHPDAHYEGADPADPANASARAPLPVVHLLRSEEIERAIAQHPDPEGIPQANLRLLRSLGWEGIPGLTPSDAE